jgi:hypothetical protein
MLSRSKHTLTANSHFDRLSVSGSAGMLFDLLALQGRNIAAARIRL